MTTDTPKNNEGNGAKDSAPRSRRYKTITLIVTTLLLFPLGYFIYSYYQTKEEENARIATKAESERIAKIEAERKAETERKAKAEAERIAKEETERKTEADIAPHQASAATPIADSSPSDSTPITSGKIGNVAEFIQTFKEADEAIIRLVTILKGIDSRQSADASVPHLEKAFKKLNTSLKKIENSNLQMSSFTNSTDSEEDEMDLVTSRFEANMDILMRQSIRIAEQDFYGSQSLERFFDSFEYSPNNTSTETGKNGKVAEFIQIVKEADTAATNVANILKGINSKRSADASVPRLENAYKKLNVVLEKIENSNLQMSALVNCTDSEEDEMDLIMSRFEASMNIIMRQLFRLDAQNYYGSPRLIRFFATME